VLGCSAIPEAGVPEPTLRTASSLRLLQAAVACASLLSAGGEPARAQRLEPIPIEFNQPLTIQVRDADVFRYSVRLGSDLWVAIRIEQEGVRPAVSVAAPDGAAVLSSKAGSRQRDARVISFVTRADGEYRIEIKNDERSGDTGRCTIEVMPPHSPAASERALEEARLRLAEANEFIHAGKYEAALAPARRALALREATLGAEDPLVADALHVLAVYDDNENKYDDAEPLNVRALAIREKAFGPTHPDVAASLYNLAWIYLTRQDYAKSEATYNRVLAIQEQTLGPTSGEITTTLNDLAILYNRQGDYDKAVDIEERVVAVRERVFGPESAAVAKTLGNLGFDYFKKGDFSTAEARLVRALRISEKTLGPDHPDLALPLNNLALVYADKGDYDEAESLHRRALAVYERALGPDHPTVAIVLNNIALIYQREGRYDEARTLFTRALHVREKAAGPNHSDVGEALNNLATLDLVSRAASDQIEPRFRRSLDILERTLGPDNEKVASPLGGLAALAFRRGDYTGAARLYERALSIREKALGSDHPKVAETLRRAAEVYRAAGLRAKALAYWTRYSDAIEHNLERNLPLGSERQKRSYVGLFTDDLDKILSFQAEASLDRDDAVELALTALLRTKGRALDAMTDTVGVLRVRANADDRKLLNDLASARGRLAAATLQGPTTATSDYRTRLASLGDEVESAERAISARSAEFRAQSAAVTLAAVRAALPADAALIEFARYRPVTVDDQRMPPRYAAFLLTPHRAVDRIDLGDAEGIDSLIDRWRVALRDPRRSDARTIARAIDEQLMRQVRERVGGVARLLISPDGLLNLVPFGALVDERGAYLVERFSITYLTSGRDLLRLQVPQPERSHVVVLGDPTFGDPALRAGSTGPAIDDSQMFFGPLPGVASELRALRTLLPSATFFTRDAATKAALMGVKGPRILHIATHGFFLRDEPVEREPAATMTFRDATRLATATHHVDNPLLRSGLALAGANAGARGSDTGVLTALEAADLDLWGTKLVVLSSCDTGVGEIRTGDGVYGLRRALVLSGAESQMMTLWPVSDRGTRDVIVTYYRALLGGAGRGDALREAQLQLLHSRDAHPYYWAGFILSGQWSPLSAGE